MARTKMLALGILAALLGTVTAGLAQTNSTRALAALPAQTASTLTLGTGRPIGAWVAFCQLYATECAYTGAPASIALTPAIWATINTVNRDVNRSVRPVTDMDHWGMPDRWDLAEDGSGDCEDFQLLKRKRLADTGLSRRAMRMTVVIDEKGEGHAVLTLITDRGDLVLDNKTDDVLPWYRTGYVFIKREATDAMAWVSLGGVTSPSTTANR